MLLAGDQAERRSFHRELWFDRDIDGRWLVGAYDPTAPDPDGMGAIVVKDEHISRFIELLGELVAHPHRFADEPQVVGPPWVKPSLN